MKQRIKQKEHVILVTVGIVAMLFVPFTPCRAEWEYLGSYLPNDPPYGSGGDNYCHWEYSCSNSTSAGSGGVSASGSCVASSWVSIYVSEGGIEDVTRSVGAGCATYGYSYYRDTDPPNSLYVDWSLSAGGSVDCSGSVDESYSNGSASASSSAYGGADAYGDSGSGYAGGSAWSRDELGSASADVGGSAEGEGSVEETYGGYSAYTSFSVSADDYEDMYGGTQFTASAYIGADSSSYGSASLTEGIALASCDSSASCSGSASTSVSY